MNEPGLTCGEQAAMYEPRNSDTVFKLIVPGDFTDVCKSELIIVIACIRIWV